MSEPIQDNSPDPQQPGDDDGGAADATSGSAAPAAESEVATLRAERDRLKDSLLRALADHDNFRKRTRRDAEDIARKAREDTLRELLPVFDNLERAAQYVGTGADTAAVAKGLEMVLRLFEDTVTRMGGKRIKATGMPFDPAQHEAIQQVDSAEHPAGTVVREELPGYSFNDRLLRPSMVVVSRGAPSGGGDGGGRG